MTLAERVRHTVERSTRDVPGGLTVAVGMGRLVVRGRVPTEEVRARVMGIAREAAPRVAVDDKLFVMR